LGCCGMSLSKDGVRDGAGSGFKPDPAQIIAFRSQALDLGIGGRKRGEAGGTPTPLYPLNSPKKENCRGEAKGGDKDVARRKIEKSAEKTGDDTHTRNITGYCSHDHEASIA
jgi:hypothetical protein